MRNILLPTDFSGNSFHAARYAARLFGPEGTIYTFVHTYMDADPTISSWTGMAGELHEAARSGMAEWETRVRGIEGLRDAEIRTEVAYGPLVGMLKELGRQRPVDLVVMGTLGRSGAGILGSNAVSVIKQGHMPVLVVPNKAEIHGLKRILFADDQRGVEAEDMQAVLELAVLSGAEVLLAHVLRTGDEEPDPEIIADLGEIFADVPHRFVADEGKDVAAVIDHLGAQEEAGMIAVLHRHVGFFEGLFRTSTSKRLALYTDTPLLVLQEGWQPSGAA